MKKVILIFLLISFLLVFVTGEGISAISEIIRENAQVIKLLDTFEIPFQNGSITEIKNFSSKKAVIEIQDLHCNFEVQKNISQILSLLSKKYKINKIFIEGASGFINTNRLTATTDENLKNRMIEKFLCNGKLTGAEYYSIKCKANNNLYGMEDDTVYKQNFKRLNKILNDKKKLNEIFTKLNTEVTALEKHYFNNKQTRFFKIVERHKKADIKDEKYFALFLKYCKNQNICLDKYKNVSTYLKINDLARHLTNKEILSQLNQYMGFLKMKMPYFVYRHICEQTSNLSNTDKLFEYILKINKFYNINLDKVFYNLSQYIQYLSLKKQFNVLEFIKEKDAIANQIKYNLSSKTSVGLEILFLSDFTDLFENYLNGKITEDEYNYFYQNLNKYKNLFNKYTNNKYPSELETLLPLFQEYYNVNIERNKFFLLNANAVSPPDNQNKNETNTLHAPFQNNIDFLDNCEPIVLINGGFHTIGIKKLLAEQHISYIVITPKVSGDIKRTEKIYESIAKEQSKMFEDAFALQPMSQLSFDDLSLKFAATAAIELIQDNENTDTITRSINESVIRPLRQEYQKEKEDVVNIIFKLTRFTEHSCEFSFIRQGKKIDYVIRDDESVMIPNSGVKEFYMAEEHYKFFKKKIEILNILKESISNENIFSNKHKEIFSAYFDKLFEWLINSAVEIENTIDEIIKGMKDFEGSITFVPAAEYKANIDKSFKIVLENVFGYYRQILEKVKYCNNEEGIAVFQKQCNIVKKYLNKNRTGNFIKFFVVPFAVAIFSAGLFFATIYKGFLGNLFISALNVNISGGSWEFFVIAFSVITIIIVTVYLQKRFVGRINYYRQTGKWLSMFIANPNIKNAKKLLSDSLYIIANVAMFLCIMRAVYVVLISAVSGSYTAVSGAVPFALIGLALMFIIIMCGKKHIKNQNIIKENRVSVFVSSGIYGIIITLICFLSYLIGQSSIPIAIITFLSFLAITMFFVLNSAEIKNDKKWYFGLGIVVHAAAASGLIILLLYSNVAVVSFVLYITGHLILYYNGIITVWAGIKLIYKKDRLNITENKTLNRLKNFINFLSVNFMRIAPMIVTTVVGLVSAAFIFSWQPLGYAGLGIILFFTIVFIVLLKIKIKFAIKWIDCTGGIFRPIGEAGIQVYRINDNVSIPHSLSQFICTIIVQSPPLNNKKYKFNPILFKNVQSCA